MNHYVLCLSDDLKLVMATSRAFPDNDSAQAYASGVARSRLPIVVAEVPAAVVSITPETEGFWPCDPSMSRKQLIERIGQMNYRLTELRRENARLAKRSVPHP
jgi:hypothetical protein